MRQAIVSGHVDPESRRPEQPVERTADTRIVVDDPNEVGRTFHDATVQPPGGGRRPIRWYKLMQLVAPPRRAGRRLGTSMQA